MATATPATTASVAQELVALCRDRRNMDAIDKLYSARIVSVEPMGSESMPAEMNGLEAVKGKNQWWFDNNEIHSAQVNGPFVGEGQFAVQYTYETTFKPTGQRVTMSEMALYTVKDGKIVKEQFYYNVPADQSA
jgi:hypothetical protein